MSNNTIKYIRHKEECSSCNGTGVYIGMAERDGAAIVCSNCNGSGCYSYFHIYTPFVERQTIKNIKRVYEANPGFVIGEGDKFKLKDFGGISYSDWKNGKDFTKGSEMRSCVCPLWWQQSTSNNNQKLKQCKDSGLGRFDSCPHFKNKDDCWKQWDKLK